MLWLGQWKCEATCLHLGGSENELELVRQELGPGYNPENLIQGPVFFKGSTTSPDSTTKYGESLWGLSHPNHNSIHTYVKVEFIRQE